MKTLSGMLGFMLLFFVPTEVTWKALGCWAVCFCAAIALLAYAGAFEKLTSKTSKQ